jgi:Lon protease-like protein
VVREAEGIERGDEACVAPLFPLPNVFLFPGARMPLHVFEPRYRAMVGDLLDTTGRLVIATIREGERETEQHRPEVLPVAGLGEIMRHDRLPDGRFTIWVLGLMRVRIAEAGSERPYRRVHCSPFAEIPVPAAEARPLVRALRAATAARLRETLPLPASAPAGFLVDLLLQTLRAPADVLAEAFVEPSVAARARYVLAHAGRTPPHAAS